MKTPLVADGRDGWGPRGRSGSGAEERVHLQSRPLALTLASDVNNTADADRLAVYGRLDEVTVDVAPAHRVADAPFIGRIATAEAAPDAYAITTSRDPEHQWFHHPGDNFRELATRDLVGSGLGTDDAADLAVTAEAHERFGSDLLVTTNEWLLSHRVDWPMYSKLGICSPREAVVITETVLRSRDRFVMDITRNTTFSTNRGAFYSRLANALLPAPLRAMRSCLSPAALQLREGAAMHLEAVLERFMAMLIVDDNLAVLAQKEGYLGSNNDLTAEQLYHLHHSLGLFTGCLDTVAWVVAALEQTSPHRREVGWGALAGSRPPKWVRALTVADAQALRHAARGIALQPHVDFIFELRNMYMHRHPVRCETVEALDRQDITRASVGFVDLAEIVGMDQARFSGLSAQFVDFGQGLMALPHKLHREMVVWLANVLNEVFSSVSWGDDGWWKTEFGDSDDAKLEWELERATELFGW